MKFWDASALVPLFARQALSGELTSIFVTDPDITAWWASRVECGSALNRLQRERSIGREELVRSLTTLESAARDWNIVPPDDIVESIAMRLLRFHALRAADALQLAAALVSAENSPGTLEFVCLDRRLSEAAQLEGLQVVAIE